MVEYCQYGCGLSNPGQFLNFDVSPSLRLQKIPFLGTFLKKKMSTVFPANIIYGDITKGLPVPENSMKGVFCSHTLEHLALDGLRSALANTYLIMQPGGIFRCVLPDLEWACRQYLYEMEEGKLDASLKFMSDYTMLGYTSRPKGFIAHLREIYGNSKHLWMWDYSSLKNELLKVGFINIRRAHFGDSQDSNFSYVEDEGRFFNALAIECVKPYASANCF